MTRKERALIVKKVLGKKYPNPPIPLNHFNNFSFLIAVLLSAESKTAIKKEKLLK